KKSACLGSPEGFLH
ncbi:hypothetical protein CP8484711_0748, partial [Chlamydia psittaci 84-8471/1]